MDSPKHPRRTAETGLYVVLEVTVDTVQVVFVTDVVVRVNVDAVVVDELLSEKVCVIVVSVLVLV